MREIISRYWLWAAAFLFLISSVVFNQSLRNTIARQQAIRHTKNELKVVSADVETTRGKIKALENNPAAHEALVRQELGYLRPGEKEVRVTTDK